MRKSKHKRHRCHRKEWVAHCDDPWIKDIIKDENLGLVYGFNTPTGLAHISYIGGKNWIMVLWYNFQLYLRYKRRRKNEKMEAQY